MINKNNLSVASRVHAALNGKGITVKPVPNTLLHTLVTESIPVNEVTADADLEMTLLAAVSETSPGGVESHDMALDEATDVLIPGMINQINFARETVKSTIANVFADVQRGVEQSEPSNLNVESVYLSSAVNSQFTVQLYENFKEGPMRQMVAIVGVPEMTVESAAALVKTGASAYDQELVEMLATKSDGYCLDVFNRYVANPAIAGSTPPISYAVCDELLVALIMYNNLLENIPEGVNMTLTAYRAAVSMNTASLGKALGLSVDIYWKAVREQKLIEWCPQVPNYTVEGNLTIRVFGPIMERFVEAGGTAEAVLGVAIQASGIGFSNLNVNYTLESVTSNKDALVEVYNHWWAEAQKAHRTHLADIIKDTMQPALCRAVLAVPEDKRAKDVTDESLVNSVKSELSKVSADQFTTSTYAVIQNIICSTVYAHTSAGAILNGLDAYAAKYPDLEARDSGYFSVRDFLLDWALSMVEVSNA